MAMSLHTVSFQPGGQRVSVPTGTLVIEAIRQAGLDLGQPCGGQGRCGRCAVRAAGSVRRRSTIRLSPADLAAGYALACQTVIEGDAAVTLLELEQAEGRLVTARAARPVTAPCAYDPVRDQTVRACFLNLSPPTLDDSIDDLARLERGLAGHGLRGLEVPLPLLRTLGRTLRAAHWRVTAVVETDSWRRPEGPPRLIALVPGSGVRPFGLAIDIGTTTVTVWLVDLISGQAVDQAAEYNGQIERGEDVISRIVYAGRPDGLEELRARVLETLNTLIGRLAAHCRIAPEAIVKAAVAGNPTMMHLFLGVPPGSLRLSPFIPAANHPPPLLAAEAGLAIHPLAGVDPLPGVAAYVGADITAGVLAAGLHQAGPLSLFLDVGTNGEMVLGNQEWLMTCACSAGPAFEGAGVAAGMRATRGAIEEVWIHPQTFEPVCRVIGGGRPRGLCGSGLIALLAELFISGAADKGGHLRAGASPRLRAGRHGPEYVVAWAGESAHGRELVLTQVDVDNLMRAKAAIYAGFNVLAGSVGLELAQVERLLIGGSFGQYLNIEKAVQIGLLPDLALERFQFLGNTAALGAYQALLSRQARAQIKALAEKMAYLELSANNAFYDAFTSALFLPHTDLGRFPSVAALFADAQPGAAAE